MNIDIEKERADFEAWFQDDRGQPARKADGTYSPFSSGCWRAWQARAALQSQDREDALVQAIQEAIALLGPEAPLCSGCEYEWNHALRVLREAIDHARRIEENK